MTADRRRPSAPTPKKPRTLYLHLANRSPSFDNNRYERKPDRQRGDHRLAVRPRCLAAIFERHFWAIHDYLRRRLDRELADELASQTFLVAFDRRVAFDPRSAGSRPWLFGIATNLVREHRRSELRELRIIAELTPDGVFGIDGVESRVDAVRMRGQLAAALADLPAEEADVLLLLVWAASLGQPEIAEALSVRSAQSSRVSRAPVGDCAPHSPHRYRLRRSRTPTGGSKNGPSNLGQELPV